jgi:hypothetical protein
MLAGFAHLLIRTVVEDGPPIIGSGPTHPRRSARTSPTRTLFSASSTIRLRPMSDRTAPTRSTSSLRAGAWPRRKQNSGALHVSIRAGSDLRRMEECRDKCVKLAPPCHYCLRRKTDPSARRAASPGSRSSLLRDLPPTPSGAPRLSRPSRAGAAPRWPTKVPEQFR